MRSGEAPIAESSTLESLRRRASRTKPLPAGMMGALTIVCWAVWIYLVLPLVSLFLWWTGVRLVMRENPADGYRALAQTMLSYSSVLVLLVGLLAIWIFWNVARYGGTLDRRTVKRADVSSVEVWQRFQLDGVLGGELRAARSPRVDLDADGRLLLLAETPRAALNLPA